MTATRFFSSRLSTVRIEILLAGMIVICGCGAMSTAVAQSELQLSAADETTVRPDQDDATLHDVTIIGSEIAWAVGDRGAIWNSRDGGTTWSFRRTNHALDDTILRSVCFLTNRVGWIAGERMLPVGGVHQGLILATRDGGENWQPLNTTGLPAIRHVQFFDLDQGIAVGERNSRYPSGVMTTSDGGESWQPMAADKASRWNAAAFTSPKQGLLVGNQGHQGLILQGNLQQSGRGAVGLRGLHGISADGEGIGWECGDGGLLNVSRDFGVSWAPPSVPLPRELDDFADFRAITHVRDAVWVTGSPGSIIWHSDDGGHTWMQQSTSDSAPLEAIHFQDRNHGIAVGQLGRIIVTRDGGRTWTAARGSRRRLACLALPTHEGQVPLTFLTRWSREDGYRSGVIMLLRQDTGKDAHANRESDLRLAHAVQTAGGNVADVDWRLPLALPSLAKNRDKLIREWSRLTDERLAPLVVGHLVATFRTWQPDIVLIHEAEPGDVAAALMRDAVLTAVEQAASPEYFPEQLKLGGLHPWTVRKTVLQRLAGIDGPITQDAYEVLPRTRTTLDVAVEEAIDKLTQPIEGARRQAYVVVHRQGDPRPSDRSLLTDLSIAKGSAARRDLPSLTAFDYEQLLGEAKHRSTIAAISAQLISQQESAGQLLGQLNKLISPLSPEAAARQLAEWGAAHHARGDWASAESVYLELIKRYPENPAALEATLWLMTFWSSAEMNWQRLRSIEANREEWRANPTPGSDITQANFNRAVSIAREQVTQAGREELVPDVNAGGEKTTVNLLPQIGDVHSVGTGQGTAVSQQELMLNKWQQAAASASKGLMDASPALASDPRAQFIKAALMRRRQQHQQADDIYSEYLSVISDDPWHIAALGEAFLIRPGVQSPKPVLDCRRTSTPPVLDGLLSDPCWSNAAEVRLGEETPGSNFIGVAQPGKVTVKGVDPRPIVFFTRDEEYLYIAASVPIHPELPSDSPQLAGRTHDADLEQFDRLSFQFDIDRDYATYYRFEVDQRGATRESCWDNHDYNPTWYCATVRERDSWRIECAIPLGELLSAERTSGTTWAVGITRIMPGIGSQSWTDAGATVPNPPLFGLMRFP